jgi:hypothetical protein
MSFPSFDAVYFTAGFLVPGFIWSGVLTLLLPRRVVGTDVRFLEFLTLSCINHGLWAWALFWIFKTGFLEEHPYWSGLCLGGIILVSPVGLGLLSALLQQRETVGRFLRRLGFRTVHPAPTAWDWHFSRGKPYWMLATMKNGSRVYGFFGEQSFAGDAPEHRDLYLEATYRLLQNGEWAPVEDTAGVLMMPDQIAAIEFRSFTEENHE